MVRNHRDLDVWKKSLDLVEEIYAITRAFPKEESYALINQTNQINVET